MEISQLSFLKLGIILKHKKKALLLAPFFYSIICLLFQVGCEKPQLNEFADDLKRTEYGFDSFEGRKEFGLDSSFNVPYSDINEISISTIDLSSGATSSISAVLVGSLNLSNDTLIVFFNGAQGHLDYYYPRIKLLKSLSSNYSVLAFDYQGIGTSGGTFSLENMIHDAHEVLGWVANRTNNSTVIVPYCLGLGAAAYMPHNTIYDSLFLENPKVILENPAAHSDFMVSNAVQFNLPGNYLFSEKFDNLSLAPFQKGSLQMILAEEDQMLNIKDNGLELYKRYNGKKSLTRVPVAGHHNLPLVFGIHEYKFLLNSFLKE